MTSRATGSTRLLTGLSTLLLVVGIGFGVLLFVGAVLGFGLNGDDVAVHTRVAAERIVDLPAEAVAPDDVEVTLRVRDATTAQHRWAAARDLAPGVLVIAAAWLLRGLLQSVRIGDPFAEANVRRLRALGLVILVGVPVAGFASSRFESALTTSAGLTTSGTELTMPAGALIGGLAAFVLAEVFAVGVRLRDDLEGTV